MKIKKDFVDSFIYIVFCIITFGFAYLLRVIITTAIRHAVVNSEKEP